MATKKTIRKSDIGKQFIDGLLISNGRIQLYGGSYYLCQNECNGLACPDRMGYKYSWGLGKASDDDLLDARVEDLYIYRGEWDEH